MYRVLGYPIWSTVLPKTIRIQALPKTGKPSSAEESQIPILAIFEYSTAYGAM